ncbi:hypothetical protein BKA65DRAFT_542990 [Rhexocercosporidium sp. MPI-PUGE-AT-0058]|nr:hypothetical protein BKA65DRAFT_542990 [Rhexocercosporidium sp. MPI-PUGE-AT-0058]
MELSMSQSKLPQPAWKPSSYSAVSSTDSENGSSFSPEPQHANIRVPESEIKRLDRMENSVRFTDGSGQMTVFHHLHCIVRSTSSPRGPSKLSFHRRGSISSFTLSIIGQMQQPMNFFFCALTIQAIMCHGDTSLITFKWGTKQPVPSANWSTPHTCRSWEALDEWSKERHVDVFQPGLVVHPKFGPAYGTPSEREGTGTVIE